MNNRERVRISGVMLPDPAWKYLVLFQSWGQFVSWTLASGIVLGIGACAIWLAGDAQLIPKCIAAGACGGAWSLVIASKAQFSIRNAVPREKAEIEKILEEWRYVEGQQTEQQKRFEQRLPGWLRWSESDVIIAAKGGLLICTGPQIIIRNLRKAVLALP